MNTVVFILVLVPIDRLMSIRIWIALLYEADTEAPKIMHTDPLPSPHDAACFRYESTTVKAIKWVVVSLSMILAPREHILVIPNVTVIFHGKGGEPCPTLALNFPSSPLVFPSCHGSVPVVLPFPSYTMQRKAGAEVQPSSAATKTVYVIWGDKAESTFWSPSSCALLLGCT